jgi:glycerate-2-kinase
LISGVWGILFFKTYLIPHFPFFIRCGKVAAGSDGNDGPTDAAGGVVDLESWSRVLAGNIPYHNLLSDNDSYHLLERSGNLIKVPPTGNNVMDVYLFLAGEQKSEK